jgi:hypothetical protein
LRSFCDRPKSPHTAIRAVSARTARGDWSKSGKEIAAGAGVSRLITPRLQRGTQDSNLESPVLETGDLTKERVRQGSGAGSLFPEKPSSAGSTSAARIEHLTSDQTGLGPKTAYSRPSVARRSGFEPETFGSEVVGLSRRVRGDALRRNLLSLQECAEASRRFKPHLPSYRHDSAWRYCVRWRARGAPEGTPFLPRLPH